MHRIEVIAYPNGHDGRKVCSYEDKRALVKRLLGHSRDGEGIETIDIDVVVRFDDPDFEGQSFGLALAIADKQARLLDEELGTRICATGIVANKGRIDPVQQFTAKIELAKETLAPGSIFVFPTSNRGDDPAGLERLESQGIQIVSAAALSELTSLWLPAPKNIRTPTQSDSDQTVQWMPFGVGAMIGLLIPCVLALAVIAVRLL